MENEKICAFCKEGKMIVNNGIATCNKCNFQEIMSSGKMIATDIPEEGQ